MRTTLRYLLEEGERNIGGSGWREWAGVSSLLGCTFIGHVLLDMLEYDILHLTDPVGGDVGEEGGEEVEEKSVPPPTEP